MTIKSVLGWIMIIFYGFIVFLVYTLLSAATSIVYAMPWWYILGGTVVGTIAVVLALHCEAGNGG